MKEDLEFGVSINPKFIPENKDGISNEGWLRRINDGMQKYDIRVRETLRYINEEKMMLCGTYDNIKYFLEDVYGYVDYSCIYLWGAKTYDLINIWKTRPRVDLELWRCL